LVFLDETWTKTNMTPLRGRARRGQRVLGATPFGHWNTSTFMAGLRHDRLIAPLVLDGPINGRSFRAYIEQFLAPMLTSGDIVIADNLGSHKVAGVREAIEAKGGKPDVSARLLTRPQPNRAGFQQAQNLSAPRRAAHKNFSLADNWTDTRSLHPNRVPQLPRKRRIRTIKLKTL
jgi:hypothetical protein